MNSIVKFMAKYADEALATGNALLTLLEGVALSPAKTATVRSVVAKLETAHAAILASLKDVDKATTIKISRADIEKAVASQLPAMLDGLVTEAVTKALAEAAAKEATEGAGNEAA